MVRCSVAAEEPMRRASAAKATGKYRAADVQNRMIAFLQNVEPWVSAARLNGPN
jgi:hypothetical protein